MSTITALCTPQAMGALAVIRISGPDAATILSRCWRGKKPTSFHTHTAHLGYITSQDGTEIDQVVSTYFKGPNSFTGEDTIEISCHGSIWIQQAIINRLIEAGATPAAPGEFSQRAFMNRRIDLAEAEAVADLIASTSHASQRLAMSQMKGEFSARLRSLRQQLLQLLSLLELELDFSEEDVEFADRTELLRLTTQATETVDHLAESFSLGQAIKEGIPIVIAGATNTGKSTLLNYLLKQDKAIVSDIHGTTRDIIEDTFQHRGLLYRIIDTAGLRHTTDPIEYLGIQRTHQAINRASLVIWLSDANTSHHPDSADNKLLSSNTKEIRLISKADLIPTSERIPGLHYISAKTGEGIEQLLNDIHSIFSHEAQSHDIIITNARHHHALRQASAPLHRVQALLRNTCAAPHYPEAYTDSSTPLIAEEIREAISHLAEITGDITTTDLLTNIFSHFCIGK